MNEQDRKEARQFFSWAAVVLVVGILLLSFTIISDGQVGVKRHLGSYNDVELDTGFKMFFPITTTIIKVNVKKENIKEQVSVPSEEGLMVDLDTSVIYRIKPDRASEIFQTVSGDIRETLIKPYIRNSLRDVASGYEAKDMYSDTGRSEISDKVHARLTEKLGENIVIEDVMLRDVKLPKKVTDAIETKIDAEQKAQAKEFELQSAERDAEIEVARARGTAEANKIVGDSISKEYIQYKFIEGLNDGNTEVIYVPTEANIPIMEAGRFMTEGILSGTTTNTEVAE